VARYSPIIVAKNCAGRISEYISRNLSVPIFLLRTVGQFPFSVLSKGGEKGGGSANNRMPSREAG
jgi:hypothetical protein